MAEQVKDYAAREAIARELDRCMMVEAGAGSGKTSSLVRRMLELVRSGTCPVENIAAVTFTRKAAAELKERFQLELERALLEVRHLEQKHYLQLALINFNRCFIGTIHSFCASLLRERPVEARIDPGFTEIEDLDDQLLREQAWQKYVRYLNQEKERLQKLEGIDVTLQELRAMFDIVCSYPDVEFARQGNCPRPDLKQVRSELDGLLKKAVEIMPAKEPYNGWDPLQDMVRQALRWKQIYDLSEDLTFFRLLNRLNRSIRITQNRWLDRGAAKQLQEEFRVFQENRLQPVLNAWWNYRYDPCLEVLLDGAAYYAEERKAMGVLNFQDLLMHTAGLLRENPDVRDYFQHRYRRILVDEFQDTDPIQAEIMFYLAGKELIEKDWRRITPREGSLFVVGDPKQSIYRFRRADINIYYEVKQRLEKTGGKILYLTTNFRSLPVIGEWAHPLFENCFPPETTMVQAGFQGLEMVRDEEGGREGGVYALPLVTDSKNKNDIALEDARFLAAWIAHALQQPLELSRSKEEQDAGLKPWVRPGDFMILLRYKENMDYYASALQEKGIPFHITGGQGLSASRELQELLHILRALQDPSDPVRLLAALRGLFFGVSDDDLYRLKKAGGSFHFMSALPAALEGGAKKRLEWAFGSLQQYRRWFLHMPPRTGVELIMEHAGMIPASLWEQPHQGPAAYPVQFLELAGSKGATSWAALISYLEELLKTGVEEEIDLEGGSENAVRLMNLHKAKGLEAPVVILANPGKKVEGSIRFHIDRKGANPRGYLQLMRSRGYRWEILARPIEWETYELTEKQYSEAEEVRLLYVAATRAKNILLISTLPHKQQKNPWQQLSVDLPACDKLQELDPDQIPGLDFLQQSEMSLQELEEARRQFPHAGRAEHMPSYTRKSVSDLKDGSTGPQRTGTGRGLSWGNVIHRLLEIYGKVRPPHPALTIARILDEEGRRSDEVQEIQDLLQQVEGTVFWQRVQASPRRMCEVPLALQRPDPEDTSSMQTISGIIDLVFEEDEGWVIADYKSDYIENEDHRNELVRYYRPQIEVYRRFWQQLTAKPVKESGIFFVSTLEWIPLEEETLEE